MINFDMNDGYRFFAERNYDNAGYVAHSALTMNPKNGDAYNLMGAIAMQRLDFAVALKLFKKAELCGLDKDPRVLSNLCSAYRETFDLETSLKYGERAVEAAPREVNMLMNYAETAQMLNLHYEVKQAMVKAIRYEPDNPNPHVFLGRSLILTGETQAGLKETMEWEDKLPQFHVVPPLPLIKWNGMRLPDNGVLLVCDQGYGDAFHGSRYFEAVSKRCKHLYVLGDTKLDLLALSLGVTEFITSYADVPSDTIAYLRLSQVQGIPGLHRSTLENPPSIVAPNPEHFTSMQPAVGLSWRSRPVPGGRSVPFEQIAKAFGDLDAQFICLQPDVTDAEREMLPSMFVPDLADFGYTADMIEGLVTTVCVDSAVANLVGCMHKSGLLLLNMANDWKWGLPGISDDFYETVRHFKQTKCGSWDEPLQGVRKVLDNMVLTGIMPAGF